MFVPWLARETTLLLCHVAAFQRTGITAAGYPPCDVERDWLSVWNHRTSSELFPAEMDAVVGQSFLEFFQTDKTTGEPKGIVRLDLRRWKP